MSEAVRDDLPTSPRDDRPLVVYFHARWCAPCRAFTPVLERLAHEHPEVRVRRVDIDDEPDMAAAHGVRSVPAVIRLDRGSRGAIVAGRVPYEPLESRLGLRPSGAAAA